LEEEVPAIRVRNEKASSHREGSRRLLASHAEFRGKRIDESESNRESEHCY